MIRSNPAGYALIINNIDFTNGLKRRNGSSVDTENLKSILLQLGYNVCVKTNLIGKVGSLFLISYLRLGLSEEFETGCPIEQLL